MLTDAIEFPIALATATILRGKQKGPYYLYKIDNRGYAHFTYIKKEKTYDKRLWRAY